MQQADLRKGEMGFYQGVDFYTTEKLIQGQQVVDKINEGRREVRRNAHIRALCRLAAIEWIKQNPVTSAYWIRGGLRLA